MLNPLAARSKTWVCGRSLAGIAGSNPAGGMDVCCECCVLSSRGPCVGLVTVQRSPTDCGVSECDHESWIMRRPWPTGGCCAMVKKKFLYTDVTSCSHAPSHYQAFILHWNIINLCLFILSVYIKSL